MRYPGGKGKSFQHVINLMPPHRVYIETHLGGGSVMRNKLPAFRNIGIDADDRVISQWSKTSMSNVDLIHGRAEEFLLSYDFRGDELIYADPPYHPDTRRAARLYRNEYSAEDHERLLSLLRDLPCMVIISGYTNPLYRAILSDWEMRKFQAKTHTDVREETLWFNFNPPQVLHDSRYLGQNFRERQTTKRRLNRLKEKISCMNPVERAAIAQWLNDVYPLDQKDGLI